MNCPRNSWMRSCYEGLNVERLFVLKNKIPLSFSGQVTKDKKDANVQMEVTSSVKYGEGKATSLGFDMQIVGNIGERSHQFCPCLAANAMSAYRTGGYAGGQIQYSVNTDCIYQINLSFLKYILTLCDPPNSSDGSLLMADIRSLPGMEGSPVFNEHACLTGVLIRPLRQKTSGAEIQLVIPWEAIVNAASGLLRMWPQNTVEGLCYQEGNSNALGKEPFYRQRKIRSSCTL
ncbi:hypothetical protein P8452_46825 [Trifolium repens]|nr:hypothetical protein P8452_46825 [Trifolium repens]